MSCLGWRRVWDLFTLCFVDEAYVHFCKTGRAVSGSDVGRGMAWLTTGLVVVVCAPVSHCSLYIRLLQQPPAAAWYRPRPIYTATFFRTLQLTRVRTKNSLYLKKTQFKRAGYGRSLENLVMVQSFISGKLLAWHRPIEKVFVRNKVWPPRWTVKACTKQYE